MIVSISSSVKYKILSKSVIFSSWLKFLNRLFITLPKDCSFSLLPLHCLHGDRWDWMASPWLSVSGSFISFNVNALGCCFSPLSYPLFTLEHIISWSMVALLPPQNFTGLLPFFVITNPSPFALSYLLCVPLLHRKMLALISVMGHRIWNPFCISEHLKIVYKVPFE